MKNTYTAILFGILIIMATPVAAQPYDHPVLSPDVDNLIEAVNITKGMVIGEAGAGDGYFTFPLAEAVGKSGRVYANDINPEVLEAIRYRCERDSINNITPILGEVDDPLFPVRDLDMVIMRYVFHDLTEPVAWMKNVSAYMKRDALLVIIDLDTDKYRYDGDHPYLSEDELVAIMTNTEFELVGINRNFIVDNIFFYRYSR